MDVKKFKMPRLLRLDQMNHKISSGVELGAWFAGVAMSFFTLMSVYNFVVNKFNYWLEKRHYEKMEQQLRMLAVQPQPEEEATANV